MKTHPFWVYYSFCGGQNQDKKGVTEKSVTPGITSSH
jgi:hypothetical protein